MRIGFDVSQTGRNKAGCGYFADSLIRNLALIDCTNEYILYPAVGDLFWDPACAKDTFTARQTNFQRLEAPKRFESSQAFWRNPGKDFEHRLGSPDIFHANNFYCPNSLRHARLVYTLYDLSFLSHPEWTTEENRVGCFQGVFRASQYADLIIAISNYTRQHFLDVFPHFPAERVVVIYPGNRFAESVRSEPQDLTTRILPKKFWLSVATIEPRKNQIRMLRAYARAKQRYPEIYPLVLAGGQGWLMEQFETVLSQMGIADDIILTGYVEDHTLQWLYENCFAFLYPSLFEGFGLPVLEAMSFGAPVITSNTSSIPEIVGDAGILIDPYDETDLASAMERLYTGEVSINFLSTRAKERARAFDWGQSARGVMDLYGSVVSQERRVDGVGVWQPLAVPQGFFPEGA